MFHIQWPSWLWQVLPCSSYLLPASLCVLLPFFPSPHASTSVPQSLACLFLSFLSFFIDFLSFFAFLVFFFFLSCLALVVVVPVDNPQGLIRVWLACSIKTNFDWMGVSKSMGVPNPSEKPPFSDSGIFSKKSQSQKMVVWNPHYVWNPHSSEILYNEQLFGKLIVITKTCKAWSLIRIEST